MKNTVKSTEIEKDKNGNVIEFTFNIDEKILDIKWNEGFKTYRYDCKGRLVVFFSHEIEKVWEYREDGNADEYRRIDGEFLTGEEWVLSGEKIESF